MADLPTFEALIRSPLGEVRVWIDDQGEQRTETRVAFPSGADSAEQARLAAAARPQHATRGLTMAATAPDPSRVEKVSDLLLHLETASAVGFRLAATVGIERSLFGGPRRCGVVHCVLAGRPFVLSPDEARLVARCIAFEDRRRTTGWLASLFETAACDAEAMAVQARSPEAA